MTQKTSSSFTVCHNFALEINYFPVLLSVRALLARLPKRNKRKVVSGSRVTLPENFACKPGLSFNPLARVTLAVGLPYLLVNRALVDLSFEYFKQTENNHTLSQSSHVSAIAYGDWSQKERKRNYVLIRFAQTNVKYLLLK